MSHLLATLSEMNPVALGLIASMIAGLATSLGAIPVFFTRGVTPKVHDGMLGFAAGVMLAATFFSLILPALAYTGGGVNGALVVGVGILLGGLFLDLVDKFFPHAHFISGPEGGGSSSKLARIWLFVIAITIHNFPEGLAVGVGMGSGDVRNGLSLTAGILLQNIPEGLAVAMALLGERYTAGRVFTVTLMTGLVEPVGALLGLIGVSVAEPVLPWALAFAAGAMLFVISDEIIPETHQRGNERIATYMLLLGVVVMMVMNGALG